MDNAGIRRLAVKVVPAPNAEPGFCLAPGGVLLVTDDGRGVAAALARRGRAWGREVALVRPAGVTAEVEPGVYTCAFASPEAVQALVSLVRARQGGVAAIVHLLPLRPAPALEATDLSAWRERLAQDVGGLFHLAQAAGADLHAAAERGGAAVLAVSGLGGAFGLDGARSFFAGGGGVAGFAKTLALEWPDVRVRAIDVDPEEEAEALAGALFAELGNAAADVEAGLRAGERRTLALEPAPVAPYAVEPSLGPDAVILLTGGARGITAEVARALARRDRSTLLLAGRSPRPPREEAVETAVLRSERELRTFSLERMRREGEAATPAQVERACRRVLQEREMRETLRALEEAGATARYFSVDMCDEEAVRRLLEEIARDYGRLDGVVHGAGIIEDRLVAQKQPDSFHRVFATKTDSAFLLARLLPFDRLRFLVFFSSVSARFGNPGQADYAAANEVLNKLAQQLDRAHATRVVAINWGPWASRGMVTPELERRFAERGVLPIPPEVGARLCDEEVRAGRKGEAEVVIMGVAEGERGRHG